MPYPAFYCPEAVILRIINKDTRNHQQKEKHKRPDIRFHHNPQRIFV